MRNMTPERSPKTVELEEQFVSTTEAMEITGVSRTTIHNAIEDGRLQFVKVGRNYMLLRNEVESFAPVSREEAGIRGAAAKWGDGRERIATTIGSVATIGSKPIVPNTPRTRTAVAPRPTNRKPALPILSEFRNASRTGRPKKLVPAG